MGILVIGDRYAGKTQFINALGQPQAAAKWVRPIDWPYVSPDFIQGTPAGNTEAQLRELQVTLPGGFKKLLLEVMDTPEEVWPTWGGTISTVVDQSICRGKPPVVALIFGPKRGATGARPLQRFFQRKMLPIMLSHQH